MSKAMFFYPHRSAAIDAVMSDKTKQSGALRIFHVIIGVIAIALAFFILAEPVLGVSTLVFLLSLVLLVLGFSRLVRGLSPGYLRRRIE